MPKYIDEDQVIKVFRDIIRCDLCSRVQYCDRVGDECTEMRMVRSIPAADVQEVKHGEWKTTVVDILHNNGERSRYYGVRCTNCKEDADKSYLYCPNCGARMDIM